MTELPFQNDLIDHLVSSGDAAVLWPQLDDGARDEGAERAENLISGLVALMGGGEAERVFLEALSAGHTQADAARVAGRTPRWGARTAARLRDCASGH